ncbi:MAG: di-heme-cytochrome C peroxidase, partial [Gammaproteobacteria bacterium]|nr:di-heme-cytochrome C peroxidase [Gammaproteobacteria bacterium]
MFRNWFLVPALLLCASNSFGNEVQDPDALKLDELVYLEQNWSEHDREWFYFADQGSRLMSYDIFINLEQADNEKLLRDPLNLLGFGLLPAKASRSNPDGLPIGFTRADDTVGLTCAACHTQQIKYRGRYIRIDGGQAMFDLQKFLLAIEASMEATLDDDQKFKRFAERALGAEPDAMVAQALRSRLESEYTIRKRNNRANR